jgi:UDP-N-acetylglucosamine 2-epimerase (non-hydrolysing)
MRRILAIFGTRPEAIKIAPVVQRAKAIGATILTCTTSQHKEMLNQVLELFDIKPDYDLQVMRPNQKLASLTARILDGVSDVLHRSSPDIVLVQGDTTTAFASSLAAFYAKIPVGHIEAGLRTYDLYSPFPEEAMRQMISRIATWHFAPTERNARNLSNEGISSAHVFVTGNTVIDALFEISKLIQSGSKTEYLQIPASIVTELASERRMVLITGHRRENFGGAIERICGALRDIASKFPDTLFLYPVHMNPNVLDPVGRILGSVPNVRLMKPVNYYSFVYLMNRAYLIISDSGGVQEEAPSLRRPVFVTREVSERMEVVESGAVKLVGTNPDVIMTEVSAALENESILKSMLIRENPYGDGHSAQRILDLLLVKE